MQINYKTTTKVLLAVVAYDTAVSLYNLYVVNPRNKKRIATLTQQRDDMVTLANLLAQKLDANGLELDEFEVFAIDEMALKY